MMAVVPAVLRVAAHPLGERLSCLPGYNSDVVWSSDGKNIVFRSDNAAAPGLYSIRSDGSGEAKRLTESKPTKAPTPFAFSPDGRRLAISRAGNDGSPDIFTRPVEPGTGPGGLGIRLGKAELFLGTPFDERSPMFSPDGRWLAYASNESGIFEVYVRPYPGPGGRWQVSTGGGVLPLWSGNGRELLFQTPDGHVMAAGYTAKGNTVHLRTFLMYSVLGHMRPPTGGHFNAHYCRRINHAGNSRL